MNQYKIKSKHSSQFFNSHSKPLRLVLNQFDSSAEERIIETNIEVNIAIINFNLFYLGTLDLGFIAIPKDSSEVVTGHSKRLSWYLMVKWLFRCFVTVYYLYATEIQIFLR